MNTHGDIPIQLNKLLRNRKPTILGDLYNQRYLYLFIIPGVIWFILFCYVPMAGLVVAFKDYTLQGGIFGSEWVGFKFFNEFINNYYFPIIMKNTIGISLLKLLFGFPVYLE